MVRKRHAVKEQEPGKKKKKKWSWKKKTLIFGTPFFLLIAFVGVFFLYQMSRSYVEPTDDQPLVGLKSDLLPKPETGVPADYTPAENAAIAEYVLKNTEHYQSTMDAQVTAAVGFINYDQGVRNTKVVDGSRIFVQALSLSSMVKVGEQKYFDNGIYLLRQATDVQSVDNCTWSDEISAMSEETYTNRYGRMPDGLSNYLITKDTVVKGEYLGEQDGLYVYQYELDPNGAATLYRRQVKTLSGSDKIPLFHEVQLTLYLDKDWRPQKTEIHEKYDVSMPVIGMATCTGEMVEVFHDYDVAEPIPEQARFQKYIDEEYDPNNLANFDDGQSGDTDIMGYISNIFETDENGIATLALDFTINGGVPQRAYVQVDTKNMAFKLKWDSLLVGYENERIYLKFGNIKYYLEQADLMDVLQKITSQIGVEMPSMEELMSEDTLNSLMENVQMLESDGKMNIVVKMDGIEALVNMTSDMQFLGAHATIDLDGFQMKLSASQVPAQQIEGFDDSYQDIRPVLDFSEPIINLINARTYAFTFRVDMDGQNTLHQNVSVRVSRHNTELSSCLIDANVNGKWLHVRIVGDTTYLSYGNLKFMFHTRDLDEIIEEVSKVIPPDALDLSAILPKAYLDLFLNLDLNAIADSIQSMEMSGDNLALTMKVGEDTIRAQVGRVGGQLSGAHLSGVTVLGSKLTLNAKMTAVSNYPGVLPVNPFGYTDLKGLVGFIGPVMDLVNANTYEFSVNLSMKGEVDLDQTALVKLVRGEDGISAKVTTELFDHMLDIRLLDGVTYVQYGNIKLRLDTADLEEIMGAVLAVLPQEAKELDLSKILPQSYLEVLDRDLFDWLDSIDSVNITDQIAALTLRIGDDKVTLSVSRDDKRITGAKVGGATIFNSKTELSLLLLGFSQEKTPVPVSDPQSYVDLKALAGFIGPVQQLLDARSYELDLSANLEGKLNWAQDAKLKIVRADDGVNLELSAQVYGVPVTVRYIGQTAYLECGNVKIKMNTADLDEITGQLREILPEDALDVDLSELLPKSYWNLIQNPEIPALIDCVKGLSLDGETLVLTLGIGDDTMTVRVAKQGDTMQSVSLEGLTVMDTKVAVQARLADFSGEVWEIAAKDSEYSDIKDVLAFIPDILELIDSNSFGFAVDVDLQGPLPLSTTLYGKLVRTRTDEIALEITARLDGEDLSLRFVKDVVYAQYGNLRLMLDTHDIEEIMAELQDVLPPEWLDVDWKEWIPPQYLELLENPDIPALIRNIHTFRAGDGKLEFGVRLADTLVTLQAERSEANGKLEAELIFENAQTVSGAVKTGGEVRGVSGRADGYRMRLYLDDYSKEKWKIIKPSEDYLDVKELLPFVKPVVNLINADTYEFDLELSLFDKNKNETISVPAHLVLERTGKSVNLRLTASLFDQELEVSLIDSTAYVSYAGLNVKMKTKDFGKISRQIEDLLPDGVSLDLKDLLPKGYEKLLKNPSPLAILRTLRSVEMDDDILTVKLKIGSDTIQLRAATDGETITFAEVGGMTVFGQTVYLTMRDLAFGNDPLDWDVDSDAYQEVRDLLDFVQPFLSLLDAKSWKFTAAVELSGETYLLDVKLALDKKNQLDFSVTTENLGGVPLCIEHTGNMTYIHYANIELYLKDADLETVIRQIGEILPEGIDLSGVLDFGDSLDFGTEELLGMIGSLRDLSFSGKEFSLAFDLGEDTVALKIVNGEKYPELVSVQGLLGGDLGLELRDLEVGGAVSIETPDLTQAVNVVDLIDCLEPTLNILRADDCTMELTVMEEYGITVRKIGSKIYLSYKENPVIALVMDVNQTTVLTDLIEHIMELVDAIDQLKDDPAVQEGGDSAADKVQDVLSGQDGELGKLDSDTLFEILQSLTLRMAGEQKLEITLTASGKDIRIAAGSVPEDAKRASLLVQGDGVTWAELTVTEIKLPEGGNASTKPDDDHYVALEELAKFVKPITKLLEARAYEFDVAVDLDEETKGKLGELWDGKLSVQVSRDTAETVSARVKATLFGGESGLKGRELVVTYVGDTVALQFGQEVKVRFTVSEEAELIQEIKKILGDQGAAPDMDYTVFLPQSYIDLIQSFTPEGGKLLEEKALVQEILRRITLLTAKNGTITAGFNMASKGEKEQNVRAEVSLNPQGTEFASLSLSGLHLIRKDAPDGSSQETPAYGTADLTVDVTEVRQDPLFLSFSDDFADLDQLAGLIDPIYQLFQADAYDFDVTVVLTPEDTELSKTIKDIWTDQNLNVKLERVTDGAGKETFHAQVTAGLAGEPLTVTYMDDVAYLSYGKLKLKLNLAGKDAENSLVKAIQQAVDSKLEQDDADSATKKAAQEIPYDKFLPDPYIALIEEMYGNELPKDMDALLDLFSKKDDASQNEIDLIQVLGPLLERFQSLHIVENHAELIFKIDESELKAVVKLDHDNQLGVSVEGLQLFGYHKTQAPDGQDGGTTPISYHDTTLSLTVNSLEARITPPDDSVYFDLDSLAEFVQPVFDLLHAKSYDFAVALKFDPGTNGKLDIDQQAQVRVVRRTNTNGEEVVDAQVEVTNFLGPPLTLTYWNGKNGDEPQIYVEYGKRDDNGKAMLQLYFSQDNLDQLLEDLPKFLYEQLNIGDGPSGTSDPDAWKTQMKDILEQLLPKDYADFIQNGLNVQNILELIGRLELETVDANSFQAKLQIQKDGTETITATITKVKPADNGKDTLGLSVSGVTVLTSDLSVTVPEVKVNTLDALDIETVQSNFTDIFGGMDGKQGVVMKALTDQLYDHPLQIDFTVQETEGANTLTHEAHAFVDQTTAYTKYKSNDGVQWMKAKVNYDSITELLPSGLYLLGVDLTEDYPALYKLAQSFGIDPEQQIKSDVLSSLFDGIFDSIEEAKPQDSINLRDAISKIAWKDNSIEILLNSQALYGQNASQQDLTIRLTTAKNDQSEDVMTISLENVHGSDTKTLNLTITIQPGKMPADAGSYMDFSSINQFYADLVNTASFGQYHLKGTVSADLYVTSLNLDLDVYVTLNDKNQIKHVYGTIDVQDSSFVSDPEKKEETSETALGPPNTSSTSPVGDGSSGGSIWNTTKTEYQKYEERTTQTVTQTKDSFQFDTVEIVYDASPEPGSGLDSGTLYLRRRFVVSREEQTVTRTTTQKYRRSRTTPGKMQGGLWGIGGTWVATGPTSAWSQWQADGKASTNESKSGWVNKTLPEDEKYAYEYMPLNFEKLGQDFEKIANGSGSDKDKKATKIKHIMNIIYYVAPLKSFYQTLINGAITTFVSVAPVDAAVIENILVDYRYNNGEYTLTVNGQNLIQDDSFEHIYLTFRRVPWGTDGYIFNEFNITAKVVNFITLSTTTPIKLEQPGEKFTSDNGVMPQIPTSQKPLSGKKQELPNV